MSVIHEEVVKGNATIAILCLFGLAIAEICFCIKVGGTPVHTGTCVGAIAGVIVPRK